MKLGNLVARFVNRLLTPAGVRLVRTNQETPTSTVSGQEAKYQTLVRELHDCYKTLVLPELGDLPGRIELLSKLIGTPVSEALYITAYLSKSTSVPGDVCEFGIAQGATSALLANEIRETGKNLYLFDSFQGLGRPTDKDLLINDIFNLGSMEKYEGTMAEPVESVQSRLRDINFDPQRVRLVPGFIEETIDQPGLPTNVCFAYVDFDFYKPIRLTLDFLATRLSVGGTVVVDDYGFFSAGAKTAVDEFMAQHQHDFEFTLPYPFAATSTPFCMLTRIR